MTGRDQSGGPYLVDDQPLVIAGLARILGLDEDIEVVGDCHDGAEVPAAVERLRPDVVLMDVRMKQVDGAEATRRLAAQSDAPRVLILTTFDDDEVVAASLAAGASGFILKDAPGEDLIRAVHEVGAGRSWLDPSITPRVLATYRVTSLPRAEASARLDDLTAREAEVLKLIACGASNHEIGEHLHITEAPVKSHVTHIFTKLDLRDRAAAIVFAYDHGLVAPGQPAD